MRRAILLLGPAVLAMAVVAEPSERSVDASIRHLRSAVLPPAEGGRPVLLSSLRQLRDLRMRSFLLQLAQHGDPRAQVHALLGLAEIDPSGHVDPWLISQLDDANARYATIESAIGLDLIDTPQMKELLGWDNLEPRSRVLLLAEILSRDEPVDRAALAVLAAHSDLDVSGLAACLLAQLGDSAALDAYRDRLNGEPDRTRNLILRGMWAAVGAYELTAATDWVAETVEGDRLEPEVIAEGVSTVLVLDPTRGVELWNRILGANPSYSRMVRYAFLLLAAGPAVPASAYDRLPADDTLLAAMAHAGKARSDESEVVSNLIELVDLGHRGTMSWVMQVSKDLDDAQATRLFTHVIDTIESGDPRSAQARTEVAFIAASRLFDIDAEAIIDRLDRAPDNGLVQEAILLGLLDAKSPAAGPAAERVDHTGFTRADSLAMILIAKHAEQLPPAQLQQLGSIAAGGGQVSEMLRAQAAWLYLRHADRIEQAMVEVFAPADSP